MLKHFWIFALLLCTLIGRASAQPLLDRMPKDTIVYIGWQGTKALGPAYAQSNLKTFMDAGDFPNQFQALMSQMASKAPGPDGAAKAQLLHDCLTTLLTYPTAVYFGGADFSDPGNPLPKLAICCQTGPDGQALQAQLQKALDARPDDEKKNHPVALTMVGDILFLGIGKYEACQDMLGGKPDNLSTVPEFRSAMAQVHKDPALVAYANGPALVSMFTEIATLRGGPQAATMFPRLLEALGVNQIHEAVLTGSFEGKNWGSRIFIKLDQPRSGLTALMDNKPMSDEMLKSIPAQAHWAEVFRFDAPRALADFRAGVGMIDPNAAPQFNRSLRLMGNAVGIDFETGLINAIGDEWVVFGAPVADAPAPVAANTPPNQAMVWSMLAGSLRGTTIINKAKDAAALTKTLENAQTIINAQLAANGPRTGQPLEFKNSTEGDVTIHSLILPLPGLTPTWAMKGDYLVISASDEGAKLALSSVGGPAGLPQSPAFEMVQKSLGVDKYSSFSYSDLSSTAESGWNTLNQLRQQIAAPAAAQGVTLPTLPAFEKIKPALSPLARFYWSDADGWHMRGIEPFPGSQALSGHGASTEAVALAFVLPAMAQARGRAQNVASAANLHQIGMGAMIYSNDHAGSLPDDLGQLIASGAINTPRVFVRPDVAVPDAITNGTPDEQVAWVNKNSSYTYVGAGKKFADIPNGSTTPLAFEKPDGAAGAPTLSVLYADGHVEAKPRAEVEAIAAANKPEAK